ncbi:MAG: 50S ribosomal protein L17 [Bacteroidales bacterium]|nr:50S ribosomal protein L17 [Bacteroidales bacterium]
MRHRKSFNHLGRKPAHRKAMLSNMATSLIMNKRITTTIAKAKALRSYVEPLLTKAKDDSTHSRRIVFSYLQDKDAVSELFREISQKITDRPGGYTRIIKLGSRLGDNAEMAIIELVDYNDNLVSESTAPKTSTRRRRKSSGSSKKEVETDVDVDVDVADEADEVTDELIEDAKVVEEDDKAEISENVEPEAEVKEEPVAEAEVVEETPADKPVTEVQEEDKKSEEEEDKKES